VKKTPEDTPIESPKVSEDHPVLSGVDNYILNRYK
jgi:hypothetical protein